MSVGIHFEHIVKKYGENVIIPDLNLDVKEGEFFTLLALPAAAKRPCCAWLRASTPSRAAPSLSTARSSTNIAPNKRNIGMVFQNYAVFHANDRARERRFRP